MSIQATTSTSDGSVKSGSLREALEIRRVRRELFSMRDAVSIVVPLCTHLADLHAAGRSFIVHPSALKYGKAGTELDLELANELPTHIRDRAAVPPECRRGEKGDARASVFSIGAILYELCTGEIVGPGMKRPREAMPSLPPQFEVLLGKALVGDCKHRPHDLAALAQALHHLAPSGSMPPPAADESHLDHDVGFDVDVSLSMMPPEPAAASLRMGNGGGNGNGPSSARVVQAQATPPPSSRSMGDGYGLAAATASQPNMRLEDPTVRLAALKEQLESDPRPRYVVVKDGMDHGPFTAVELLQQIASHQFIGAHPLRDTISGDEKPIEDWDDFALFARHAGLNREIKQERKALEGVVAAESHRTQWKALVGATLLGVIVAAGAAWWLRERSRSENEQTVREDKATNVDSDAALSAGKNGAKGPGGVALGGGGGKYPQIAGGGSCEAAQAKYVEDYSQQGIPPDLTAGAYTGTLNKGTYLNSCGVPSNMSVSICAAVQNGRAVGVTVVTTPSSPGHASCVRGAVMGMGFPAHPRMDVVRTTFAAQ